MSGHSGWFSINYLQVNTLSEVACSGYLGEEDPALNEKILGGAPYYEFYITPYCKAFLKACFTLDSKKRPTTAELLAMPWIEHHRAKDQNTAEPSLF